MKKEIPLQFSDIQYKEGILEFLNNNSELNYIILEDNIPGNLKTQELVQEILKINKKIKIIIISKNNYENIYKKIEKFNKTEIKKIIEENSKTNKRTRKEKNENKKIEDNNKKENKIKKLKEKDKEKDNSEIKIEEKNKAKEKNKIKKEKNKNEIIKNKMEKDENKEIETDKKKKEKNNKTNNKENTETEKKYTRKVESKDQETFTKIRLKNDLIKIKNGKIICILGSNGVGKSIFSIMLSRKFLDKNILIIDFDFFNSSLHTILNVKKYPEKIKELSNKNSFNKITLKKQIDISDFIIETKYKNINLISGLNILFDFNKEENYEKLEKIIKKLKQKYDIIIFDTSLQTFFDYTKKIMEISDVNIMISGANLLEVKKTTTLLKIYNEEWKIEKNKIKLVFNKCTKNSIDYKILKKIFDGYKIIGKIKLSDYYDIVINNCTEKLNEIENEVKKIGEQILTEKDKAYKIIKK